MLYIASFILTQFLFIQDYIWKQIDKRITVTNSCIPYHHVLYKCTHSKLRIITILLASVPNIFRTFNQTNKSSNMFWEELLTLKNIEQLHNMNQTVFPIVLG